MSDVMRYLENLPSNMFYGLLSFLVVLLILALYRLLQEAAHLLTLWRLTRQNRVHAAQQKEEEQQVVMGGGVFASLTLGLGVFIALVVLHPLLTPFAFFVFYTMSRAFRFHTTERYLQEVTRDMNLLEFIYTELNRARMANADAPPVTGLMDSLLRAAKTQRELGQEVNYPPEVLTLFQDIMERFQAGSLNINVLELFRQHLRDTRWRVIANLYDLALNKNWDAFQRQYEEQHMLLRHKMQALQSFHSHVRDAYSTIFLMTFIIMLFLLLFLIPIDVGFSLEFGSFTLDLYEIMSLKKQSGNLVRDYYLSPGGQRGVLALLMMILLGVVLIVRRTVDALSPMVEELRR